MADIQLIGLLIIVLLSLIILTFIVKRHYHFARYVQDTNIPFIPVQSFIKGSYNAKTISKYSVHELVDIGFKSTGNMDYFGTFVGTMPFVIIKDMDLIYKIWITDFHKHTNRSEAAKAAENYSKSLISIAGLEDWTRTRKAIGSLMTPLKLKSANFEYYINASIDKLMKYLDEVKQPDDGLKYQSSSSELSNNQSKIIDACNMAKIFNMDLLFNIVYDRPNEITYDNDPPNDIIVSMDKLLVESTNSWSCWTLFFPEFDPIVTFFINTFKLDGYIFYVISVVMSMVKSAIIKSQQRMQASSNSHSFSLANENEGKKLTDSMVDLYNQRKLTKKELNANSLAFIMAAWETTTDTLTSLLWQLAKNPKVQDKLRDSILKEDDKYIEWTIKETLRLNSPSMATRTIGEDFSWEPKSKVSNQSPASAQFKRGMCAVLLPHLFHLDKNIWGENVLEFVPERFEKSNNFHPAQFAPFGLGRRNCVGSHLALLELKLAISRIILEYEIFACKDTPEKLVYKPMSDSNAIIAALKGPIKLMFKPLIYSKSQLKH